ncbi:MAG: ATP-binding protein, partial [Bacteroidetes bacterium]|nr:ATP-binding protein [Bacteroidota bacterium]
FQVEFLIGEISYRYGFEATSERVTKEWLFFKPNSLTEKPLFVRMEDEIEIVPSKFKEGKGIEARTRANALFLSSVAQWNGEISTKILEWFDKLVFFDRWDVEDDSATMELLNDDKYKILMEEVLSLADLAINGLEKPDYEEVIDRVTSKRILLPLTYEHLYTLHKVYDQNNNEADVAYFEMDAEESTGTRNFFNLIGQLIVVVENGKILLGDELNAHFHHRLMQAIVMLFNSKIVNNKGGQFIFTTHDTNLIDTNFLSRDQIYFLEKNRFGASRLYSLVDFKTRSEDNHEREYFQGRYGAIPFIENLENAFEKIENGKTKTKAA